MLCVCLCVRLLLLHLHLLEKTKKWPRYLCTVYCASRANGTVCLPVTLWGGPPDGGAVVVDVVAAVATMGGCNFANCTFRWSCESKHRKIGGMRRETETWKQQVRDGTSDGQENTYGMNLWESLAPREGFPEFWSDRNGMTAKTLKNGNF